MRVSMHLTHKISLIIWIFLFFFEIIETRKSLRLFHQYHPQNKYLKEDEEVILLIKKLYYKCLLKTRCIIHIKMIDYRRKISNIKHHKSGSYFEQLPVRELNAQYIKQNADH